MTLSRSAIRRGVAAWPRRLPRRSRRGQLRYRRRARPSTDGEGRHATEIISAQWRVSTADATVSIDRVRERSNRGFELAEDSPARVDPDMARTKEGERVEKRFGGSDLVAGGHGDCERQRHFGYPNLVHEVVTTLTVRGHEQEHPLAEVRRPPDASSTCRCLDIRNLATERYPTGYAAHPQRRDLARHKHQRDRVYEGQSERECRHNVQTVPPVDAL